VIDLFLLSTVFYITALELYELFIDDRIKVSEGEAKSFGFWRQCSIDDYIIDFIFECLASK
jgi:uncharacterized membrane protein YqhA